MPHQYKGHCDKSMIKYIENNIEDPSVNDDDDDDDDDERTSATIIRLDIIHYIYTTFVLYMYLIIYS